MQTYHKEDLSKTAKGYFRWFGGKRFWLGKDEEKAKRSAARLEQLYSTVGEWNDTTLEQARTIIKEGKQTMSRKQIAEWLDGLSDEEMDILSVELADRT